MERRLGESAQAGKPNQFSGSKKKKESHYEDSSKTQMSALFKLYLMIYSYIDIL